MTQHIITIPADMHGVRWIWLDDDNLSHPLQRKNIKSYKTEFPREIFQGTFR